MNQPQSEKYNLYFLDTGIHPISKETRNHKIQLLIYSSLMLILCIYFKENTITMILGVKFITPIEPKTLLPLLFTLTIYHFWMFKVTFNKSMKEWENKKSKLKDKSEFRTIEYISNLNNNDVLNDLISRLPAIEEFKFKDDNYGFDYKNIDSKMLDLKHKHFQDNNVSDFELESIKCLIDSINRMFNISKESFDLVKNLAESDKTSLDELKYKIKCLDATLMESGLRRVNENETIKKYENRITYILENSQRVKNITDVLDEINKVNNMNKNVIRELSEYTNELEYAAKKININSIVLTDSLKATALKEDFWRFKLPYKFFPIVYSLFCLFISIITWICYYIERFSIS